jgi:hypothetical protein|tara:strand:- start:23 stop:283 length:261 start_codon:yes stop_codon:yes gene_type:complete
MAMIKGMEPMKDLLIRYVQIGIGKTEAAKITKGFAVGGIGAALYSAIVGMGYMPDALAATEVAPYTVAGLAVVVNSIRQLFTNHLS